MTDRAKITAGELVVVLSNYDLGAIDALERFKGGSRQTPKVLLHAQSGEFLLKRRSIGGPAALARVQRAHDVHHHLHARGVPVPELIRARSGASYFDAGEGRGPAHGVYEIYRFVRGDRYQRSPAQAHGAGLLLSAFHHATDELTLDAPSALGGYHARADLAGALEAVRERLDDPRARPICRSMLATYQLAADRAEGLGVSKSPGGVVHADWHPGNMVFAPPNLRTSSPVLAIVDLDSVRVGPRVLDVANGALQFAVHRSVSDAAAGVLEASDSGIHGGVGGIGGVGGFGGMGAAGSNADHSMGSSGAAPARPWRIVISPELLGAFCAGYRRGPGLALRPDDWRALPWLMCQALIVEAVHPIAATGSFGKLNPLPLLALVDKTAGSIVAEQERLVSMCGSP